MHLHILGICGAFMGGIALLARALGHQVSGSDAGVYPPMSKQLAAAGIRLMEGYESAHLEPAPDLVVVGNALSRGNPAVEAVLNRGLRYTSGPQWLAEHVLAERWVLAVAGTHGKTSTASLLAWLLEDAGLKPGFLIGGVPQNFGLSARLGETPFFVVEADEYDTAFFDKRSKFVHYRPRTLVLNNLEFDHADIFDDLAMIQRQFHHLLRTVPGNGKVIAPCADAALEQVLAMGCWTPVERFSPDDDASAAWSVAECAPDCSRFRARCEGRLLDPASWSQPGRHNLANALAALAAARHAGVPPRVLIEGLRGFRGVRRRMELRGEAGGVRVFDDFAHHPTAIAATLEGLRRQATAGRILAVLEPRSNTMRLGVHAEQLPAALAGADAVWLYVPPALGWDPRLVFGAEDSGAVFCAEIGDIVAQVAQQARPGDRVVVMSNGGFGGIHDKLLAALRGRFGDASA